MPLGPRECIGVVWAENPNPDPRLDNRLKDVGEKLDVPPLQAELRAFVDWVANYTLSARGMVLRMSLADGRASRPRAAARSACALRAPPRAHDAGAARALRLLSDGLLRGKCEAAREAGVSVGVIDGLLDEGTLEAEPLPPRRRRRSPIRPFAVPDFSPRRAEAADALRALAAPGGFHATLIDGVTGSGKTEVYFEAVAETIRRGRQTLILMPEIALTGQSLDRFTDASARGRPEWHSEFSPRTRARTWAAVAANEAPVVVGARSALFLPYADLGLIVVDEEHDPAYKQEDGAHYHARDMAVVRGAWRKFRWCSPRRRRRSNPRSTRGAAL